MLYYKATAGCGARVLGRSRCASAPPRFSHPGSCSGVAAPAPVDRPLSFATAVARSLAPSVYLVPSSHPPPFVLLHVSCVLLAQESTAKPSPLVSVRRCMNQAVPRRVSPIVS